MPSLNFQFGWSAAVVLVALLPQFARAGTEHAGPMKVFIVAGTSAANVIELVKKSTGESASDFQSVAENQPVSIGVGVNSPAIWTQKDPDVTFDVKVLKPDGTTFLEQPGFAKATAKIGSNLMSGGTMDMTFETADPDGAYTFLVTARDANSGSSANAATKIVLKKGDPRLRKFDKMEDVEQFVSTYYESKLTAQVVPALEYLVKHDGNMTTNPAQMQGILHFLARVAHDNPPLVVQMREIQVRSTGNESSILSGILSEADHFSSPEATSARNLDLLWSEFFATGDPAPLRKIIGAMKGDAKGEMLITAGAAGWSLSSNGIQHARVFEILKAEQKVATGTLREKLEQIVKKVEAHRTK